jgi:hypothetical protein
MTAFETSVPPAVRHREMKAAEQRAREEARQASREARTSTQERRPGIARPGQRTLRHIGWMTLLRAYPPAMQAFREVPDDYYRLEPDGAVEISCPCDKEGLPLTVEFGRTGLCTSGCGRVFINLGKSVRACKTEDPDA